MRGRDRLAALTDRFSARTIIVLGDLICDEYLIGKPARISREAPVIILKFTDRDVRLGGAANAAHNVHTLGARVVPIGVVGRDRAGDEILGLFHAAGIPTDGIVTETGRATPVKTRIMAGGYQATRQQVVRLDREPGGDLAPTTEDALIARLMALAPRVDGILVSDYGYGTLTPRVFERVRAIARRESAIVTADSRYDLPRFPGVTAATPNEAELGELTGENVDDERAVEKAGRLLLERLDTQLLLVTRGSQGMALLERDGAAAFIPIFGTDEIADVTGAGDTVIGAFTLALASGATPVDAATLANMAGGIVVMKRGTATVTTEEISQALGAAEGP
ncbi:MAG TPA: PfkB family carbohydrate kinase [Solirubrobacteraceae bacterium]